MPFNGSGSFTRLMSWVNDATAGIKIRADRHDQEDDNFAAGLSQCITKNGETQPVANIPMNGFRIISLADPIGEQDAVTKKWVTAFKEFSTGMSITGADVNGRLNFAASTGLNGLSFTGADLGWLARIAGDPANTKSRMVLNDKPDGSGTDVISVSDSGQISGLSSLHVGANYFLSTETPAQWRALAAGFTPFISFAPTDGAIRFYAPAASVAAGAVSPINENFRVNASGDIVARGNVYSGNGSAYLQSNGNIIGSIWTNFGYSDAYNAINNRIESRALAYANDRVAALQYRKVSLGYNGTSGGFSNMGAGTVVTGYSREGGSTGQVAGLYYMTLQIYDPVRGWVSFSG